MGVLLGFGDDFDEVDLFGQPVGEVGQGLVVDFFGEEVANVLVAGVEVPNAFAVAFGVEILAVVERLQAGFALFDRDVEGSGAEAFREDHLVDGGDGDSLRGKAAAQVDEQEGEGREALLAIDDGVFASGEDDAAHEVNAVLGDVLAFVGGVVVDEEFVGQVVDEFLDLLVLPRVFALVVVDGVLRVLEQLFEVLRGAGDFLHACVSVVLDARNFEFARDGFGNKRFAVFAQLVGHGPLGFDEGVDFVRFGIKKCADFNLLCLGRQR